MNIERFKENLEILKQHNLTHRPVFHITDGKKHEVDLINEIVKDCEEIIKDEEQGLIKRFPCKVGDTVYVPYNFKNEYGIATVKIEEIKIYDNKNHFMFFIDMGSDDEEFNQMFGDWKIGESIGTSIFLTCAEAEKKLEKLSK